MDRVRTRIPGLGKQLFRFDYLVDLGLKRFLDVKDVNPARTNARHDQIATLKKGMPGQRRQGEEQAFQPKWWNSSPVVVGS